ncbi:MULTISPECIES: hypothetical protein [unclassified Crossiella]|uniref:hypothetical protein n=1 Tax=unclassified Crossiella TaxID=2620835 RepID=UPI001FFF5E9D|nr:MULTISPECIES: hypothetical protein [unclassified Crossiella]MCK2241416.1 hypothetical protein [Crossiella sp. S99.2]MCK2257034.1 hypothetical protein [Crossiella sp. S99.1]
MRTPLYRRLTVAVLSGALLAGTLAATPIAHAAVPVDEAGLANALFGATMRIANRDDALAKNLVVSAELLDWRAKNPQAAPAAVTAHLSAVRKHVEAVVPNQAWNREPVETVSAALVAARSAPGATVDGARLGRLNNTLLGLDTVPVSTKPEDRVSGAQLQFAWEAGYADNQREVWSGVALTARADTGFRGAWNAEIGDQAKVNSAASATELGQGEQLRTVLDVGALRAAAQLGPVKLKVATDTSFNDLVGKLYAERKEALNHLSSASGKNPPDAKPTEPTDAQKTAAKSAEDKRKGYVDTIKGGLDGLAFVVGMINPDFAKRITKFAEGAVKVAYAVNKAITAFTLINSAFSLATAAFTGNVIGAISSLIGVFGVSGPTVEQQILDQIKEMRKQLEAVQQNMNDRFDKVDAKLDNIYNRMLAEFAKLEMGVAWVRENTEQILAKVSSLSTELQVTGTTLLKAVAGLYKLDRWGVIDYHLDHERKHHGQRLPEADFKKGESDFWVTAVQAPTNDLFVVPQVNYRTDSPTVLSNLNLHGDGGAAAFLGYYANAKLDPGFTHTGHGGNAEVWSIGANAYGLLVKQNPEWARNMATDVRGKKVLDEGRAIRDQLLAFSQSGPDGGTNKIFQTLLAGYQAKADELSAKVLEREAEVNEGKTLALWRGPEQGAPAGTPSLYATPQVEPCLANSDPAWNFKLSRANRHNGQHLSPPVQFYRYFRGHEFGYRACWSYEVRLVPGSLRAYDLVIAMTDEFTMPGGGTKTTKRNLAVVHRWNDGLPAPHEIQSFIKNEWDRGLKATYDSSAVPDSGTDFTTPFFAKLGEDLLKSKRADFYNRAATFVKDSLEGRELNLAARLLRAYTEAGFPRALNTDEFLRSALHGPKALYGAGQNDNQYLVWEYQLAGSNVAAGKPAWDPVRSDVSAACAVIAATNATDPVRNCLRDNMKSRQDRLAARLVEQFKQRWEGADQTLPGLQTQLRTLWLTLRSVWPDFDFGPAIEAPAPLAPAAAIWNQPEHVDNTLNSLTRPAITSFKGNQFTVWQGTDGKLYGSLANSRGWAPKVLIDDGAGVVGFGPTAIEFNGKLVVSWKKRGRGEVPVQTHAVSTDGITWTSSVAHQQTPGVRTFDAPALAVFNGSLYALHRGEDQQLYRTTSTDGLTWTAPVHTLAGNMTNQRPGMTVHNGKLYVAWRGHDSNPRAYMASSVDGVNWVPAPVRVGGTAASVDGGPVLASHGGKLYAVWGFFGDVAMYGAYSTDGTAWSPQYTVARTTRTGPAGMTVLDGRLRLVWGPPGALDGSNLSTASSAVLPG